MRRTDKHVAHFGCLRIMPESAAETAAALNNKQQVTVGVQCGQ